MNINPFRNITEQGQFVQAKQRGGNVEPVGENIVTYGKKLGSILEKTKIFGVVKVQVEGSDSKSEYRYVKKSDIEKMKTQDGQNTLVNISYTADNIVENVRLRRTGAHEKNVAKIQDRLNNIEAKVKNVAIQYEKDKDSNLDKAYKKKAAEIGLGGNVEIELNALQKSLESLERKGLITKGKYRELSDQAYNLKMNAKTLGADVLAEKDRNLKNRIR